MYRRWTAHCRAAGGALCHTVAGPPRATEWGSILDVPVLQGPAGVECFKCPKRRSPGEAGWYFVHFEDDHRIPGPCRLYVCPRDYLAFAAVERERWTPVDDVPNNQGCGTNGSTPSEPVAHQDGSDGPREASPHQNGSDALTEVLPLQNGSVVSDREPVCTADELVALLTRRGLAGWAFLVRDVAAGRVRRLHLRQLPAEQEVREALVTYLQSAGTALTISRIFLTHQQRSRSNLSRGEIGWSRDNPRQSHLR